MGYKAGFGTIVYHPELSMFGEMVEFGSNCKIHSHVWIGKGVKIGDNVKIQAFTFIPEGVEIRNNVFIGPRVTFTNDKHPPSGGKSWQETHVRSNVVIGAGAIILPGLTLNEGCMIGAGAVVTKDVPAHAIVVGSPAKQIDS